MRSRARGTSLRRNIHVRGTWTRGSLDCPVKESGTHLGKCTEHWARAGGLLFVRSTCRRMGGDSLIRGAVTAGTGFPIPFNVHNNTLSKYLSLQPSYHVLLWIDLGSLWFNFQQATTLFPRKSQLRISRDSTDKPSVFRLPLAPLSQFFIVAFVLGQHQSGWGPALIVLDFLFSFFFLFLFCPYYSIEISSVLARTTKAR